MPDARYQQRKRGAGMTTEHVLVAERALGRRLPTGAVVHHVDENPRNNVPTNLVICPDQAYHMLLHRRARALDECGHADWRKCNFCGRYDSPESIDTAGNSSAFHRSCRATYERERRQRTA